MSTIYPLKAIRRVYCAGPLFNESERREMVAIAAVLSDAGFEPFLPHADGFEFAQIVPVLSARGLDAALVGRWVHEAIFALDTYQVFVGCGSLVLNMNGRVPDEGAVAEAAMAWTLGKPVVIHKADARSKIAGRDNPLIVGQSGFETVERIEEIGAALQRRLAEMRPDRDWQTPCPPQVEQALARGERLSAALAGLDPLKDDQAIAELVFELFGPQAKAAPTV